MSKGEKIEKPWGSEEIIERNDKYVVKRLFMQAGHQCSLQYHQLKHETFYVISGKLSFQYGKDAKRLITMEMLPGDSFVIPTLTIHRMSALEDCIYLETSTPELMDVVRISDDYGR